MTPHGLTIAGRVIGANAPPFIVAELSANHNGELARALAIVEAAASAGADAIKLQTYTADTLTLDSDRPEFRIEQGPWAGQTLHELYRSAQMPLDWHKPLFARGRELGLIVFSTPFDDSAVALLESLAAPAYKIASFEIVDLRLIARVAATGKPMILSTGMADLPEIEAAVACARDAGNDSLALLHCVSGYPTPVEDCNLATIPDLAARTRLPVGLSDHTLGTAVAVAAVALGAVMIEKHLTLARADGGPDAAFSIEPDELAALVRGTRAAWAARGAPSYRRAPSEAASVAFRRSLFAVEAIAAGEPFTARNVRSIRPGHGLAPKYLPQVLGRVARRAIARGEPLSASMIEGFDAA